jgi:hypothetical protein
MPLPIRYIRKSFLCKPALNLVYPQPRCLPTQQNNQGNTQGRDVFCSSVAFGVEIGDSLTHNMIIIHLRKALDKWIAFENKSNEHQYPTDK